MTASPARWWSATHELRRRAEEERKMVFLVSNADADVIRVIAKMIDMEGYKDSARSLYDIANRLASAPVHTLHEGATYLETRNKIAKARETQLADAIAKIARLRDALGSFVNAKALAGVRKIVAGWDGEGRSDGPYPRHDRDLGATLPKTNCGAIYELDEAMQAARALIAEEGTKS